MAEGEALSPMIRALTRLGAQGAGLNSTASSEEVLSQIPPEESLKLLFQKRNPLEELFRMNQQNSFTEQAANLARQAGSLGQTTSTAGQFGGGGQGLTTESFDNIGQLQAREQAGRMGKAELEALVNSLQSGQATQQAGQINPALGIGATGLSALLGGFLIDRQLRQDPFNSSLLGSFKEGAKNPLQSLSSGLQGIIEAAFEPVMGTQEVQALMK